MSPCGPPSSLKNSDITFHRQHHHLCHCHQASSQPPAPTPTLNNTLSPPLNDSTSLCSISAALKMAAFSPSQTTLVLLILIISSPSSSSALNVTTLLSSHPDLSDFTNLLTSTSVASDLAYRSSLTILAVPNSFLRSTDLTRHPSIADVIRYHVLLEYLSWPDLLLVPETGKLVATLYQTTGRASGDLGSVNITRSRETGRVSIQSPFPDPTSNASILNQVETVPYNLTVFAVDSLLIPSGFDTMASDYRPPPGINITDALLNGHNFNVAVALLSASGLVAEFEADEGGAGITLFAPTDEAFAELSPSQDLQSLAAEMKAVVLRFHVLRSYYPLGSLESIVNPVQPTLATESMGAGRFTLNISKLNGSVAIDTGVLQATVTQTVCDQNPVAIFGVSRVLLPRELFGKNQIVSSPKTGTGKFDRAPSPIGSYESQSPAPAPSIGAKIRGNFGILFICIALCLLLC
uniref:FAS1 domain-containing protein n=1 Tax=Kalanchoe fedtschenkoi TaxID=63787 RepID=A0A7N0UK57_KALFE